MLLSFALLMTVDTPTVALVGDPALVRNEAARLQRQARVLVFPLKTGLFPAGKAYRDNAETHRVWRTLATEGVDLVLTDVASLRDALAANDVAGWTDPCPRVWIQGKNRAFARASGKRAAHAEEFLGSRQDFAECIRTRVFGGCLCAGDGADRADPHG